MRTLINFSSNEVLSSIILQEQFETQMIAFSEELGIQDYEKEKIKQDLEEFFLEIDEKWFRKHPNGIENIIKKIIYISDFSKPGIHIPYEIILEHLFDDPTKFADLLNSELDIQKIIYEFDIDTNSSFEDYSDGNRDICSMY